MAQHNEINLFVIQDKSSLVNMKQNIGIQAPKTHKNTQKHAKL
jgi:hypothetical protein